MRVETAVAVLVICILCVLTSPVVSILRMLNSDLVYFPDQEEYIKQAVKCPEKTVYWPGTRRCYKEGEQGPCNFGRVIYLDTKLLRPFCKDEPL